MNSSKFKYQLNTAKQRYLYVDVLRGLAVAMMIIFHFSYDLDHFQFIDADFYRDPFWLNFRTLIVSLFLCLVGVSLYLAMGKQLNLRHFLYRLVLLVGAATLVSVGSYFSDPNRVILFGVLHFIVIASVLGLLFRRLYWTNLLLGIALVVLGNQFQHVWFNAPTWHWIGLMTHKPITQDYVPLLPWFGVVLLGMFFGQLMKDSPLLKSSYKKDNPVIRLLRFGGVHSLIIYLLHQPLLFGAFYLFAFFN